MATERMIRVIVVEDHALLREGLQTFLESFGDVKIVGEAVSGEEALEKVERILPDVVVMDINIHHMDGITATRKIHGRYPTIPIVGLTVLSRKSSFQPMLDAGAFRVLTKGETAVEGLYEAIKEAVTPVSVRPEDESGILINKPRDVRTSIPEDHTIKEPST
ncbi:MAG TPA: response regulator transcription factor [Nitrospira sp.]|nr:response regulator transcription factor [Nitrospira sp.]